MTAAVTSLPLRDGANDSWDDVEANTTSPYDLPAADIKPDVVPSEATQGPSGTCPVCNEPIYRQPGEKRRRKYHPDCKPGGSASSTSDGGTTTVRRPRGGRAESEADVCIVFFQQQITRACVMLSVVDRYDAFCIMVSMPQICENLRAVLTRYDGFRKEFLAMTAGGSMFGLGLSIFMCLLPIAAHHGLLGKSRVAHLLMEMPFTLLKISERLKEGSEALTKLMAEQIQEAREQNQRQAAARAAQNAEA